MEDDIIERSPINIELEVKRTIYNIDKTQMVITVSNEGIYNDLVEGKLTETVEVEKIIDEEK
jgi:hypothetical protein